MSVIVVVIFSSKIVEHSMRESLVSFVEDFHCPTLFEDEK